MPYSFTEIERRETRVIHYLWLALFFVYDLLFFLIFLGVQNITQNILQYSLHGLVFYFLSLWHILCVAFVSIVLTALTCHFAQQDPLGKIRRIFRARALNDSSREQILAHIIEEVIVACGNKGVMEGVVLPFSSLNILAVSDKGGRGLIAVTEGALEKLSRAQLEAAVAHEAAYIVSGDAAINTTVSVAFTVYSALFEGMVNFIPDLMSDYGEGERFGSNGHRRTTFRGRTAGEFGESVGAPEEGGVPVVPQFIIIVVLSYVFCVVAFFLASIVTKVMAMAISRSMVRKADAVATRMTRDPKSLAEAIYIMAYHFRGSELPVGRYFHPIFFIHPSPSSFDDQEGTWAELFGTHPPVDERIQTLCAMAHVDLRELEGLVPNLRKVVPYVPSLEGVNISEPSVSCWQVLENSVWKGPYDLAQLKGLPVFHPGMYVRRDPEDVPRKAADVAELSAIFTAVMLLGHGMGLSCPSCKRELKVVVYEGEQIGVCSGCLGTLVDEAGLRQILAREEVVFSEEIKVKARALWSHSSRNNEWRFREQESPLGCPSCSHDQKKMIRRSYSGDYPVDIDHCNLCGRTWFDRDELEILQFLYENRLR
ncbi:MAG: M48 family metalloprotease [Candidatus Omnitrophica bacterium]|nr:M48 family metalloprotease [Candidatus Omnitrophota bacterium]